MGNSSDSLFIGLMSGTSFDGVDGVLVRFGNTGTRPKPGDPLEVLDHVALPMPDALRQELLALNTAGPDELHRSALAANALARLYAENCRQLLQRTATAPDDIRAVGAHGQTVRHRPGPIRAGHLPDPTGYTLQLNNPALLAELTGCTVVADFRSRDVTAGGQGAPLVPAFHAHVFGRDDADIAVLNLGGISNLTLLQGRHADRAGTAAPGILGFDCGPANALMDHWIAQHRQLPYDRDGAWAATGTVHAPLLAALMAEPFFRQLPPKSTGRDLFHPAWLDARLAAFAHLAPEDVQATLLALTVDSVIDDLARHQPHCLELLVCGGGSLNGQLMRGLQAALAARGMATPVIGTDRRGLPPLQVEATAFAWLARCALNNWAGNLPSVTGAAGPRVLGSIYPA